TNNGTKKELFVDASPVQQAYLKFQLAGLTGNTVTSAKLRLYVTTNGSVKGGSAAKVSNTSWGETTVTYNTRPTIDGPVLSTLGAVNTNTWYEFDVTGAVTGDGLVSLGINTVSTDGVRYASRENTGFAPQLVVTLTPGDTTPPDTTLNCAPSTRWATSTRRRPAPPGPSIRSTPRPSSTPARRRSRTAPRRRSPCPLMSRTSRSAAAWTARPSPPALRQ